MQRSLLALVAALACVALAPRSTAQAAPASPQGAAAQMLRLRDGTIQWGSITSHDPDGIQFQRLDNGGVARLAWSFLHPEEERHLRTEFGYVDVTGDEVMLLASRVVTVEGAEIVGLLLESPGSDLMIKTSTATIPVPKNRIAGVPTDVQVPALEIFTRDELYAQRAAMLDTSSPQSHFDLAQYCERVLDFAHAVEHYERAAALDSAFRPDDVRSALARSKEKAARQKEIDYLSEVELLIARRRFDEALVRAEAFKETFPGSTLLPDAKRKSERAIKARDRFVTDRVAQLWHFYLGRLARDAASKMTYEQALAYVEGQLGVDVLNSVARDAQRITKEASADAVKKMWSARPKGRWQRVSYSSATWLLGEDAALKGSNPNEEKEKAAVSEKDKQRADLEKKLQRFLENQQMARKAKSSAEQKDDREAAWKELSSAIRTNWIIASYAENSGDMEVNPKPSFAPCPQCGATGTLVFSLAGGNVNKASIGKQQTDNVVECPTCHGLGVFRKIYYR